MKTSSIRIKGRVNNIDYAVAEQATQDTPSMKPQPGAGAGLLREGEYIDGAQQPMTSSFAALNMPSTPKSIEQVRKDSLDSAYDQYDPHSSYRTRPEPTNSYTGRVPIKIPPLPNHAPPPLPNREAAKHPNTKNQNNKIVNRSCFHV